jgi:ATP-dependent RNA/DNA helicase IGHMBP2
MNNYFSKLRELLLLERKEDEAQFQQLNATLSVQQRRANGTTWYPVAIRAAEPGRGDYITLELERTTHQDVLHQFKFGASVALFSNHEPQEHRIRGTVSHIAGNTLKMALRIDELPDWTRDGKLGLDLLFDDNSYDEMEYALQQANVQIDDTRQGRLSRVVAGTETPEYNPDTTIFHNDNLNESQQQAVQKILAARDLAIVHGPPGTGKTTTLVAAIKALILQEEKQILVTAPSNAAVDLLSEKLSAAGLNVIRIGNPARVSDALQALTLDSRMLQHPQMKAAKQLKKQAQEFRNMAHKYKRNFGKSERDQRKALFDEAHKILKEVTKTEQYISEDLLNNAQVITATLVGSQHYTVRDRRYETVVIDEAAQALEPACWIPILKGRKLVLAGDHMQLSPTIKSAKAAESGLGHTLFEKCLQLHPQASVMLEVQYRMHEQIMQFPSVQLYNDRLKADKSIATHSLKGDNSPLMFIDTAGCGFEEKLEDSSTFNPEEAAFTLRHLSTVVESIQQQTDKEDFPSIAVISPYRQQIQQLKEYAASMPAFQKWQHKISINTIDSFQGQERDIVYISLTRSNDKSNIGFLNDTRRMNVAMTRAKKKLVIIGDSATLSAHPFYAAFIDYATEKDAYHSAWSFMNG